MTCHPYPHHGRDGYNLLNRHALGACVEALSYGYAKLPSPLLFAVKPGVDRTAAYSELQGNHRYAHPLIHYPLDH